MPDSTLPHSLPVEEDDWYRSVPFQWRNDLLRGGDYGGRWDVPGELRALYLGKPLESAVVEIYRHLIDPFPAMVPEYVQPRSVARVTVRVGRILDLRDADCRDEFRIREEDLHSEIGDYGRCQTLALGAASTGYHGILAPAATGLGLILAVFVDRLSDSESLTIGQFSYWPHLPPDPRIEPWPPIDPSVIPMFSSSTTTDELAWQAHALCAGTEPEAFFPEKGGSIRRAKRICQTCSVRGPCLLYALKEEERFGVWGGLDGTERFELQG
jgi:hypothetical protein